MLRSLEELVSEIAATRLVMECDLPYLAIEREQLPPVRRWSGFNDQDLPEAVRARVLALHHPIEAILAPQAVDALGVVGVRDGASHDVDSLFAAWMCHGVLLILHAPSLQASVAFANAKHPNSLVVQVWNLGAVIRAVKGGR